MARLEVHQLPNDDVYSDTIRVHLSARNGIREGRIVRVSVDGRKAELFAIRGLPDKEREWVRLDEIGRDRLGVTKNCGYDFVFHEGRARDLVRWALNASDPAAKIATLIALWLGGFGAVLGVAGLFVAVWAEWGANGVLICSLGVVVVIGAAYSAMKDADLRR